MKKLIWISAIALSIIILFLSLLCVWGFLEVKTSWPFVALPKQKINGLVFLIENSQEIEGILKWEKELDQKGLTALIKANQGVIEKYPHVFQRLAQKGHEIALGYSDSTCWDMPYAEQLSIMKEYKEFGENIIGQPIRVFSCKYFSYDQSTLDAAQSLGMEYVLARGTQDVRAVVYSPEEYSDLYLISVSNVEFEEMGRGSLCDISLWARGSTGEEFLQVFQESLDKNPDSMILVSHAHLGGTKKEWWGAYEEALNSSRVTWRSFDNWMGKVTALEMPNEEIPVNREVKYMTPTPAIPMEELEPIEELDDEPGHQAQDIVIIFHNNRGPMCVSAKEFLQGLDYPIEEHLDFEIDFWEKLDDLRSEHEQSSGVSDSFGYYPIIFIKNKAYSGFNDEVRGWILEDISS